jgi:hypothetical protein
VNGDGRTLRFCARLVMLALAGGIMLELMHAIEGASPGFRPADEICRSAPLLTRKSGNWLSEKIMLDQRGEIMMRFLVIAS